MFADIFIIPSGRFIHGRDITAYGALLTKKYPCFVKLNFGLGSDVVGKVVGAD
jgi:hypothetical protein